jgi:hypothetical protein
MEGMKIFTDSLTVWNGHSRHKGIMLVLPYTSCILKRFIVTSGFQTIPFSRTKKVFSELIALIVLIERTSFR